VRCTPLQGRYSVVVAFQHLCLSRQSSLDFVRNTLRDSRFAAGDTREEVDSASDSQADTLLVRGRTASVRPILFREKAGLLGGVVGER